MLRLRIRRISFGYGQIFQQHNSIIVMNAVVTSHLPVCLYSAAGGRVNRQATSTRRTVARIHWTVDRRAREGESPDRVYPSYGGTTSHSEYLNRFSTTSSGKVFFGPSAFRSLGNIFTDQAHYEKQSSTAKGLLLGVCFVAEGPLRRNTFERLAYNQTQREGTHRSYYPRSFGIVARLETKGCTDLKRKRPISPW